MASRKRELRVRRVIEACSLPGCRRVTYRAILRQSSGHMVRILGAIVITEVARHTGLIQTVIYTAFVAACTS